MGMRELSGSAARTLLGLTLLIGATTTVMSARFAHVGARQDLATPAPGTPSSTGLPLTPTAADCTVEPVPFPEPPVVSIPELSMTPPPSQSTGGTAANASLVAAVIDTLRIQIGCVNAGDIPRALALAGGDYYTGLFANLQNVSEGQYGTLATPLPRPEADRITIVAVEQVMSYPDNTLTAQVTTGAGATTVNVLRLEPNPNTPTGYMIVQQEQLSRVEPSAGPNA